MSDPTAAPKDLLENADFRDWIIKRCDEDKDYRQKAWDRCSRDFVFWCDTFVWTLASKDRRKCPKVPFVLFLFQEKAALNLIDAVGREDRLVEKSRDMGATWLIIAVFCWYFIFRKDHLFLVGSRKQEFVDKSGSPKTIFYKIDFLLKYLPKWMRPPIQKGVHRTENHLENPLNGSVIDGESTNENFGAGDRRAAVLLDEFALVKEGYRILGAVGDVTDCCIYNSTPLGASGAYYDTRQKMESDAPHRILRFHWTDHPRKRRGLYTSKDGVLEILDKEYKFPANYKFILDGRVRSVAYDYRELRSPNRQIMAAQWDIDYLQSGHQFFDAQKLEATIIKYAREPISRGELIYTPDWNSPKFLVQGGGRLMLWFNLPDSGQIPVEWDDVVVGVDIASGSGGEYSSNSSASIARRTTGEKIAEITDNRIMPQDFAKYCLGLCKWFNDALLIFERNGPNGSIFGKVVKDSNYRNLYYPVKEMRYDYVASKEPGFWTDDETKPSLLADYAEALWTSRFINPSKEALRECSHYVQNGTKIEHSRSLPDATEDPTAVGEAHGDRCIADSLANKAITALSRTAEKPPDPEPPPNSMGGRRLAREREAKKLKRKWGRVRGAA